MGKCENYTFDCKEETLGCKGCAYCEKGMTINTKYSIGQKIWCVIESTDHQEIKVFSSKIDGVFVDSNKNVLYYLSDICDDIEEKNVVAYDDENELLKRIKTIDEKINNEVNEK